MIRLADCTKTLVRPQTFKHPAGAACVGNSWAAEAKQHHTWRLLPDLTARSFEDDEITLKCKGDMTVSSEPDGSILSLVLSVSWAVVRQPCLFFSDAVRFWNRLSLSGTMSGMLSMSRFPFLCCSWNIEIFNLAKTAFNQKLSSTIVQFELNHNAWKWPPKSWEEWRL